MFMIITMHTLRHILACIHKDTHAFNFHLCSRSVIHAHGCHAGQPWVWRVCIGPSVNLFLVCFSFLWIHFTSLTVQSSRQHLRRRRSSAAVDIWTTETLVFLSSNLDVCGESFGTPVSGTSPVLDVVVDSDHLISTVGTVACITGILMQIWQILATKALCNYYKVLYYNCSIIMIYY